MLQCIQEYISMYEKLTYINIFLIVLFETQTENNNLAVLWMDSPFLLIHSFYNTFHSF